MAIYVAQLLYRVAQKNATTLIINFMNIVDETELFLFYLVEYSFSNKMTPRSLVLGKVSGL